jgi:ATP-dependent helicase HrpB
LSFNALDISLPVAEVIPDLRNKLHGQNTLILNAPPGAGKSTLLPLALMEEPWLDGKKIIMLEPRRLAAKSIATRMADLLQEKAGERVGYRVRFDTCISAKTRIEVVTEGILTRMLQNDNALENVGLVIFDEFHERNINADLALALCRDAQQVIRPDLRILVMSATLNLPQLQSVLSCDTLVSEGKLFPVHINYTGETDLMFLPEQCARVIYQAAQERAGDILAFLPGEAEIKKCAEQLTPLGDSFAIHPLYGQLNYKEQWLAISPNKFGKRKIVLATSIAETSLTIEGVSVVVDSGFTRSSRFDIKSGLSKLETLRISKDAAAQRAGRAGRLGPGYCYRLWSEATQQRLSEHRVPEILETDLCDLMLDLAQWGVKDVHALCWMDAPPKAAMASAIDTLHQINALESNRITEHGKKIHQLACHPRIAHMLLMADDITHQQLACDIAAVLEERDPLPRESGIDICLRIEGLRRARQNGPGNAWRRLEKVAASYCNMLRLGINNNAVDPFAVGLLIAFAYPERIASARPGNNAQFQLANGRIAVAGHKDDLAHEPWLAIAHMDMREGLGKIFLAAPLNPKDLISMVAEKEVVAWDSHKGGLVATKELKIGALVLQSKPIQQIDPSLIESAISKAIENEGEALLNIDEIFIQLQNRLKSLALWNPDQHWPSADTEDLLKNNKSWLSPYYAQARKIDDLKKIDLSAALKNSLAYVQQQNLAKLAPEKIEVPSGSHIPITYMANGAAPVLSVRLQEVFGLSETPKVNGGKMPVVMHLLSPGYKPVQVTSDLKSFWNILYFEVKKELQRRYPKHAWPDDPWTAPAVAKGRSTKK